MGTLDNLFPYWEYDKKIIDTTDKANDFIDNFAGMVYKITYEDGKMYIGKKSFKNTKVLHALKSKVVREGYKRVHKIKHHRRVPMDVRDTTISTHTFNRYVGSHKETTGRIVKREVLELCSSKRNLTYTEVKYLFKNDVLETNNYLNKNINGSWFKGNIQ